MVKLARVVFHEFDARHDRAKFKNLRSYKSVTRKRGVSHGKFAFLRVRRAESYSRSNRCQRIFTWAKENERVASEPFETALGQRAMNANELWSTMRVLRFTFAELTRRQR